MLDDPQYLRWLSAQEWFRTKHTSLYQIIINRGSVPEETPEHNALQVLFLDDKFCERFLRRVTSNLDQLAEKLLDDWRKVFNKHRADDERKLTFDLTHREANLKFYTAESTAEVCKQLENARRQLRQFREPCGAIEFEFKPDFEVRGIDVDLRVRARSRTWDLWTDVAACFIELKPSVGDDYPAVLRQMKANGSGYLLLKEYVGTGATREQFIKTFATAGKTVIFLDECSEGQERLL
jgi:hypothetical protein